MANKSIGDLPEGMISEILVRLPVKSLLQCKSVCKPWLSLISSPHFVKSQFLRAIMASMNTPTLITIEKPPPTDEELAFEMKMVEMEKNFVTWTSPAHERRQGRRLVKIGFGYDSISDAYKVFRIVCEKIYDKVPIVQVYSTSTDSWREFRDPILKNYEHFDQRNTVVNGVLYFDSVDELIAFDMHTEVFGQVPFPSLATRKGSDVLDFEGSVAMVFQSGPEIDLWTLDDVSGKMSWTKKLSIEADSETEIWLTKYLGAGQFFGQKLLDGNLFMFNVLYDYRKKEIKFYKQREENIWAYLKYTETLVSLDGFEHVE